ncbi:formimidoylglutamate deiminase [Frondihabitans sp. PAMC 28766]|uniref:formimidoylglutamate deiminase n=1 Tax=Frondihabitans sp. PAMC 28766 TaxID=1795630 RepID=UPI00078B781B|nr:formimidoylglutamate deiminase [Frondihabitans sp. PAMC 28766]AMM18886.1 formimidoylglutamate deiminase [Frondihabitans sp. PAMC 28766]
MTSFWVARAVLPTGIADGVRITADDGRITRIETGQAPEPAETTTAGVALPGLVTAHSHAFHRALRGRTHDGGGSFWTWRERMYRASRALTPDGYYALASGLFSEMLLAGYTAVGEFHYVHHRPGGASYTDPNAMSAALVAAATDVGIRLTLLDTFYRWGGLADDGSRLPLSPDQARFADGSVEAWASRHEAVPTSRLARSGMAAHSLRAVDAADIAAMRRAFPDQVLHAHVSEQPAENRQVAAATGSTPIAALDEAEVLDRAFTAVHATHLTDDDVARLGRAGAFACFCPTTERDLADGVGPGRALLAAGAHLCLGSDQNAVVDPFEEARGLELDERLVTGRRGVFSPAALLTAASSSGYESLGWAGGGVLAVGAPCDFVVVDDASPRTAGSETGQLWLTATAADVTDVVVDGVRVVAERVLASGRRTSAAVGRELVAAIAGLDAAGQDGFRAL